MSFVLGKTSESNLVGVKAPMVILVRRAIQITEQDFIVYDGIRTRKEQEKNVAGGVSKTMDSKHLTGHAVDLVPWIKGQPTWDWLGCYKIAEAMQKASRMMDIPIIWGGCWDKLLDDIGDPEMASKDYVKRRREMGKKKVFVDGPHFELA